MKQAPRRGHQGWAILILLVSIFHADILLAGNALGDSGNRQALFEQQADRALDHLLRNLDDEEVAAGAVIASPSKHKPDYYYHWVRDAALVMNAVLQVYIKTEDPLLRERYRSYLLRWVDFERGLQKTGALGEPKFYVNGDIFTGPWGRPQNDGPAAQAVTLIRFAETLLAEGREDIVREKLYAIGLPAKGLIKVNLEFTAHHWSESSFDLWEEVRGQHFYTRMMQRSALILGAQLAMKLGDPDAASYYRKQATKLESALRSHRNFSKGLLEPTLDPDGGWSHKAESLDVAVPLAALHASLGDGFFDVSDEWILASAAKLESRFRQIFPINRAALLGVAIGRYPEDVYDGNGFSGGNPWFLATHAYAELYCRAADAALAKRQKSSGTDAAKHLRLSERWRKAGLAYLERALRHRDEAGHMSEQFSRYDGYMVGAADLSWSYASYLTAYMSCFASQPPEL